MASSGNDFKIGVMVVLAVVVLGGGILLLKEAQVRGRTRDWKVGFPQAGGLNDGDPVYVNGVKQGAVEDIYLDNGRVVARLRVHRDVELSTNSQVQIVAQGLMGERTVAIDLGPPGSPWPADSIMSGRFASGVPEVMGKVGSTVESVDSLLLSLKRVMDDLHSAGALSSTMRSANQAAGDLASILKENRAGLREALEDFHATASELRHTVETRKGKVEASVDQLSTASARLSEVSARFEETSKLLHEAAQRLDRGEGTLGKLSRDEQLYNQMHQATQDLDALLKDIKENPRKYLKISLF